MLSTLPKLADRNFIIGFFVPSLLFVLAVLGVFHDQPSIRKLWSSLADKDLGDAVFLVVGVWVLGVLLLTLNHWLYRLLEGYLWPVSMRLEARNRYRERRARTKRDLDAIYEVATKHPDQLTAWMRKRYAELRQELYYRFPADGYDVLPTRFGNAIKAFETYPLSVYGADGVPIWLRLATVIPKDFSVQIDDARCRVDFCINTCALAMIVGVCAAGRFIAETPFGLLNGTSVGNLAFVETLPYVRLLPAMAAVFVAWVTYLWAVAQVYAWGDLVRTAFDCYLPALAKGLGFVLPSTQAKREEFWGALSLLVTNGRRPDGSLPFKPEDWEQVAVDTKAPAANPTAPAEAAEAAKTNAERVEDKDDQEDEQ